MNDKSPNLNELRSKIRGIDDQIYALVAERLKVAKEIGDIKLAQDLPVKDYGVEKEVIEKAILKGRQLGLYDDLAQSLAKLLIKYAVMEQDEFHARSKKGSARTAQNILVIGGAGRMGRWLSEFFHSFGHSITVFDPASVAVDGDFGVIGSLDEELDVYDVIVIASPISTTATVLDALIARKSKALIFDICSLKSSIHQKIIDGQSAGLNVTSIHPMFGPNVQLLAGRNILFCTTERSELTIKARQLFSDTTAHLVDVPLERHDELMGYVLGLSHLSNLVFARTLETSNIGFEELNLVASTTFNAQLEVARPVIDENQELYYEIQHENHFTPALIQTLQKVLGEYGEAIADSKSQKFVELMDSSRGYLNPRPK